MKANSVQGKFVNEEHMHLTVEFLGEIQNNKVDLIKQIMDELEFEAFTLRLDKIGYFRSREGNICWLGIKENDALFQLNKKLRRSLTEKGFALEDRAYQPHVTIGRKVIRKDGFSGDEPDDMAEKIKIDIDKVDLMKSEFINGRLIHSVVYSKPLRHSRKTV